MKSSALVLTVASLFVPAAFAQPNSCPIEDDALLLYLSKQASRHHRPLVDKKNLSATWSSKPFDRVKLSVGGCEHFSIDLSTTVPERLAPTEAVALATAAKLAAANLPERLARQTATALKTGAFTKTVNDGKDVYSIKIDGFLEFALSLERKSGNLEIALGGTGR